MSLAAGCSKPPQQQAPPPTPVTVAHPIQHVVVQWDVFDGHIASPQKVNVEAQVSGQIVAEPFQEGSAVKQGQILFEIDPVPFQATLAQKQADAAKSMAQKASAQSDFDRYSDALKSHAISQQIYDNAKFALDQANAQYESDIAAVALAKKTLSWCYITAPITGKVGSKLVTVGNLVVSGTPSPPVLTTIQSVDPLYCNVNVDEASVQRYAQLAAKRQMLVNAQGLIPCYLQLDNETGFPHEGYVDFAGNAIDVDTGTLPMRGVFPNPAIRDVDGEIVRDLIPGNHALLRIAGSPLENTLLVPDEAILSMQNTRFVLIAGPDGNATPRPVKMGSLFGPLRAIVSGLKPDDEVIINGQARVIPGVSKVAPTETTITYDPAIFVLPNDVPGTQPSTEPTTEPIKEPATSPATTSPSESGAGR